MTNSRTQGGAPAPRRAEPLQPDRPASGEDTLPTDEDAGSDRDSADKLAEQARTAIENNREGFGD